MSTSQRSGHTISSRFVHLLIVVETFSMDHFLASWVEIEVGLTFLKPRLALGKLLNRPQFILGKAIADKEF